MPFAVSRTSKDLRHVDGVIHRSTRHAHPSNVCQHRRRARRNHRRRRSSYVRPTFVVFCRPIARVWTRPDVDNKHPTFSFSDTCVVLETTKTHYWMFYSSFRFQILSTSSVLTTDDDDDGWIGSDRIEPVEVVWSLSLHWSCAVEFGVR